MIPSNLTFFSDIVIVVLSLIFAAVFKKYFNHIYRTGHENLIKSFVWGVVSAILFFIFLILVIFRSSEAGWFLKLMILLYPFMAIGFATGAALLLGIIGLGGGKTRYLAILIMGGAMTLADQTIPFIGKTLFKGVFFYGMGATLLSFFTPMKEEEESFFQNETEPRGENARERVSLEGDITPILPPRKNPDGE